jgi:hypothetical protein
LCNLVAHLLDGQDRRGDVAATLRYHAGLPGLRSDWPKHQRLVGLPDGAYARLCRSFASRWAVPIVPLACPTGWPSKVRSGHWRTRAERPAPVVPLVNRLFLLVRRARDSNPRGRVGYRPKGFKTLPRKSAVSSFPQVTVPPLPSVADAPSRRAIHVPLLPRLTTDRSQPLRRRLDRQPCGRSDES